MSKFLLDLEPSVIKKIGKLLDFDETELALIKSFQNGNYDLSTLILLYLQDNLTTSQFFKILSQTESVLKKKTQPNKLPRSWTLMLNQNTCKSQEKLLAMLGKNQ